MSRKNSILSSIEQQKAVQRIMGHKNIKTTYSYVTDLSEQEILDAANNCRDYEEHEKTTMNIRASQLKILDECVQKCVQIAVNDFKL